MGFSPAGFSDGDAIRGLDRIMSVKAENTGILGMKNAFTGSSTIRATSWLADMIFRGGTE
jgi:hypothetical protein